MDSENEKTLTAELDIKVLDAGERYFNGVKPQTINRWIREIARDYGISVGYTKAQARWLTPTDINVLREYQEGVLKSSKQDSCPNDYGNGYHPKEVEEVGDEGFTTFSTIADQADEEISKALAIRDNFVEDRALIIAQEFSPNTIARDILTKAISKIEQGSRESLGEIAKGGMHRQFRRTTITVEPIRSLRGVVSPMSLESSPPQE